MEADEFVTIEVNSKDKIRTERFESIQTRRSNYGTAGNGLYYYVRSEGVKHVWPTHEIVKIRIIKQREM